ncbi:aldo/keto reductase [Castellaniella defragrans]|uniref:Oxidoreductase of aldo/keto reductase family, subgroup 1 n=2 Tax=Castellaniella defragrans TaxID=75697 RepID=W8WTY7_CASD6|nr:aldo/keto reductase [Castellaniella defragrans]KAB0618273.1 aldo/keto reductase [Castellaniella defragrans]MBB6082057.1 2,5-diketo-D-gluconate reductase A [Castellaniella defragrans]CDM23004.1 oxidoreductase of aldo/keto reductase family, subgroup 1 [Castellaniella defragrans 65Phen]
MSTNQPYITFHDGRRAPQLGMGTWRLTGDAVVPAIHAAVEAGYRSIDTAAIYGNESEVGRGIAGCGVPREDLFVATKVWNDRHGHDSTKAAFQESLDRLGLDYVDLYLIHWPVPKQKRYVETWEALIQLRDEGRARSIGVCNFQQEHLQRLLDATGVLPVLNQIELHPRFQQAELRAYHADHDIRTEAWSPLGQGQALRDPVFLELAHRLQASPAQVILRWHIQMGHMVIPKSSSPERLQENFNLWNLHLDEAAMERIATLDRADGRIGPDPETFHLLK